MSKQRGKQFKQYSCWLLEITLHKANYASSSNPRSVHVNSIRCIWPWWIVEIAMNKIEQSGSMHMIKICDKLLWFFRSDCCKNCLKAYASKKLNQKQTKENNLEWVYASQENLCFGNSITYLDFTCLETLYLILCM